MELGEIVEIHKDLFRKAVEERGFSLRGVLALMKSYCLNEDYLSHRIKKGTIPINVFVAACKIIDVDFKDYIVEYDLSAVPSYQMIDELRERGMIK